MVGLTIGSLTAGYFLVLGRNRAIIYWEIVALVGCGLTLVRTIATICIGRLLIGLAAGLMNVACAKAIDETIPIEKQAFFGASTNLMINFGVMIAMALGFILPTDPAMELKDKNWRIIFAVPGAVAVAQIILLLFVFREEPLGFLISKQRLDEAKSLAKRVYSDCNDERAE